MFDCPKISFKTFIKLAFGLAFAWVLFWIVAWGAVLVLSVSLHA